MVQSRIFEGLRAKRQALRGGFVVCCMTLLAGLAPGARAGRALEFTRDPLPSSLVWTSRDVTVRGVRLGDSRTRVKKLLGKGGRGEARGSTLEYPGLLIRFGTDRRVDSIGLKKEFAREIQGGARALLDDAVVADESVRQRLLGQESERDTEEVSMSRVRLERVSFHYPERGIEVQGTRTEAGTTFSLLKLIPPKASPPAP